MCGVGGGYFQGEGQEKILPCKGGGGHYMKNKNIGGCVLSTQPDQQKKAPMQKCAKKSKKLSNIEKCFLASFAHSAFTKFIFLEQLTAVPQFNMQNMLFLFSFFLSSHHDTNPLLHLYHFRKKNIIIYWLILTVNHQGSFFLFSFFFVFIEWVKHFCTPANFVTI